LSISLTACQVIGVLAPAFLQVALQVGLEGAGEHDDSILTALAVANGELMTHEVDVVDACLAALLASQPGAVEEAGHQPKQSVVAKHSVEELPCFFGRQHDGQAPWPLGAEGVDSWKVDAEHLLVQEQQGKKRLVLRAGRDVLADRQFGEELFDLRHPPSCWGGAAGGSG
jgi:hypothetical protein